MFMVGLRLLARPRLEVAQKYNSADTASPNSSILATAGNAQSLAAHCRRKTLKSPRWTDPGIRIRIPGGYLLSHRESPHNSGCCTGIIVPAD